MSSNYAGVNSYHGQITIPSDGDPAIAESVNVALRALQDDAVYFATEIAKRLNVVDGGTYTMLGTSLIIQGTPNWHMGVDVFFEDDVTHGDPAVLNDHVVSIYDELRVRGDANLRGDARIGSGTSQTLDIRSTTNVFGPLQTLSTTTLGNGSSDVITVEGTLVANAPATFNDDVAMADLSVANDTVLGSGASSNATVNGQFAVTGSSTLGNSSTDSTTINGTLDVTGDVTLGNAASDTTTVTGDLNVNENTVLGTNSSDSVTIPASLTVNGPMSLFGALSNALTFTGFGRVPDRTGLISAATTVNVGQGNVFISTYTGGALIIVSMSDTGAADGDRMVFMKWESSGNVRVALPDGSTLLSSPAGNQGFAVAWREGGAWYGMQLV